MKLHLDRDAFEAILLEIQENTGTRADILEKDYYVTLILEELSGKQAELQAYFKGGTALYKALGSVRRFSEDIDLTVSIADCSKTKAGKRLRSASKEYVVLPRLAEEDVDKKGGITSVYIYDSVVSVDKQDLLQRFERVKVEATSFTVSEPVTPMVISAIIYKLASPDRKRILSDEFEVKPFTILTQKLERIFVDKIFASEFYFERKLYFDVAKHVYDIVILLQNEVILDLIRDKAVFQQMVGYKRKEERERLGGVLEEMMKRKFAYLSELEEDMEFAKSFELMQRTYVLDDKDQISFDSAISSLKRVKEILTVFNL